MNIAILCVGKLRERFYADAAAEYLKRLTRYGKFEVIEHPDLPEPQNASDADRVRLMEKEGAALLKSIRQEDFVTALCIDAKQLSSTDFAAVLKRREMIRPRQVFVIGGSLGLSKDVLRRADDTLSMSDMTFPHQLARVMLLEQIYRAQKILAGEKYHK